MSTANPPHQPSRPAPTLSMAAALALLVLSGCTHEMSSSMLGHGKQPLDSPEAMARDSREILAHFEQLCFSDRAVWRRMGTLQAECTHNYTSRWGLMDGNIKWFEALTRGVQVFDDTVQTRYPNVLLAEQARGGSQDQSWGQSRYWHWRYLLGDGSVIFKADRTWSFTWNMMETAYSSENVKMTLRLEMTNECLRAHPQQTQLVACPAMREALYASPLNPADLNPNIVASNQRSIQAELSSIDSSRGEAEQVQASLRARYAQEQRDSQLATQRGLQQGLSNVVANSTVLPAVPVPPTTTSTNTVQSAQTTGSATQNTGTGTTPSPSGNQAGASTQKPNTATTATSTQNPGTGTQPRMADFQEAVVYCWATQSNQPPAQPQDERWICHGPTQLIQVAETLPKAIAQAGCGHALQQGRRWPFGQGTLYGCGFGRETYDENVVARYAVPSGITGQLQNYRCAIPHNGRCSTPK